MRRYPFCMEFLFFVAFLLAFNAQNCAKSVAMTMAWCLHCRMMLALYNNELHCERNRSQKYCEWQYVVEQCEKKLATIR